MSALAAYFGGPGDGGTRVLTDQEVARGYVDTTDALGNTVRHTLIKLARPKQIDDYTVDFELRPTKGVW